MVVLAHQAHSTLCLWVTEARRLAARGYTAIVFDFRNNGASQFRKAPADSLIAADVTAAVKLARTLGARKVFVVGASMGGWASIVAGASLRPSIQGIVSVSAPAQWYGDAIPSARRLTVPVLYVAASGDGSFAADARALYAATASGDKTLKIVPGPFHGVDLIDLSQPARTAVETFIRKH